MTNFLLPRKFFSWKLIIKYHHLPHPCSYCPLGKNSKKRNFWVNHFCWAHRGAWVASPINPKSVSSTRTSVRDTNTEASETRVPLYRELAGFSQAIQMFQIGMFCSIQFKYYFQIPSSHYLLWRHCMCMQYTTCNYFKDPTLHRRYLILSFLLQTISVI